MHGMKGPGDLPSTDEDALSCGLGLDESSAMLRAEAAQLDARLRALVQMMSSVPGLELSVSYRQGKIRSLLGDLPYLNDVNRPARPIQRIATAVGGYVYWLNAKPGSITCGRDPISPRPECVSEMLTFSIWARALFDEVVSDNVANHDSMVALRRLVEHDRVD